VIKGKNVEASQDYLLVTNKTTTILNKKGEIIQDDVTIGIAKHGFLKISGDGFKPYYTPATNFFAGNSPKFHFDDIGKGLVKTESGGQALVVAQKGKFKGLIQKNGDVILDFVFDDIFPSYSADKYVSVKYKGYMGIIWAPFVPEDKK